LSHRLVVVGLFAGVAAARPAVLLALVARLALVAGPVPAGRRARAAVFTTALARLVARIAHAVATLDHAVAAVRRAACTGLIAAADEVAAARGALTAVGGAARAVFVPAAGAVPAARRSALFVHDAIAVVVVTVADLWFGRTSTDVADAPKGLASPPRGTFAVGQAVDRTGSASPADGCARRAAAVAAGHAALSEEL
jgi:hypothetical protein